MATSKSKNGPTLADLVKRYNELTGQNVKRFADRKTAERRLAEAEKKFGAKQPKQPKATGTNRRRGFNFPVSPEGVKEVREGTNRAKLVDMLTKGATFEECVKKAGFKDERNTYQAIRLLHTYVGFGMKEENGVIKLVY